MSIGRRCDLGCETWPDQLLYRKCLVCGGSTRRARGAVPLPIHEALMVLLYHEFETFYEKWCAARQQSVEGPLHDTQLATLSEPVESAELSSSYPR